LNLPDQFQVFEPERKSGVILHGVVLTILLLAGIGIYWFASTRAQGSFYVLLMMILVVIFIALPVFGYRVYALLNARYLLERDGLRLRWGLRLEDIPVNTVEWVRLGNESGFHVTLPPFIWNGAILGHKEISNLGMVEFIASSAEKFVLIATHQKIYAISPQDPKAFVASFQRILELGSLSPIPSRSSRPAAFLRQVWQNRSAKMILIMSTALTITVWVLTGFMVANYSQLSLSFNPDGTPLNLVPSEQILLLPVLAILVYISDVVIGLFFFRKDDARTIAFLLWTGGVITPLLLLISIILNSLAAS